MTLVIYVQKRNGCKILCSVQFCEIYPVSDAFVIRMKVICRETAQNACETEWNEMKWKEVENRKE